MIQFQKFDGTGNDFVLIDARHEDIRLSTEQIAHICHRRFGVGADGLMLLKDDAEGRYDFVMKYYNSDGNTAEMCGNGGRCIALFAHLLGISPQDDGLLHFLADDGPHTAQILQWDEDQGIGIVRLSMRDIPANEILRIQNEALGLDGWSLNTGVPHFVQRVQDLEHYDIVGEGRRIRNLADLWPNGTNVDFIEDLPDGRLMVRTYERGVEDETWACGTGVTACAIVSGNGRILAKGGDFRVAFRATGTAFTDVMLTGTVCKNFVGTI